MSIRLSKWIATVGAFTAGALVATQSRVNGNLAAEAGNGFISALVPVFTGLAALLVLVLIIPRNRRGFGKLWQGLRTGSFPWWGIMGGVSGSAFVLGQSILVTTIGLALFSIGIVAGQVIGGLFVDRIGIGPAGSIPITGYRWAGAGLAIIGVSITAWTGIMHGAPFWLLVVPFLMGTCIAWQTSVNGLVSVVSESAIVASFVNFFVGAVPIALIAVIAILVSGWPTAWPSSPLEYLGGIIGIGYVAITAALVRVAGVLLLSLASVAGQLLTSLLFEIWIPFRGGFTWSMLVGVVVVLLSLFLARSAPRAQIFSRG